MISDRRDNMMGKIVDTLAAKGDPSRKSGLLADRALAHIRTLIASAELGPGDRINEVEIAAQLGISRGPVREAIRRLASTGLTVSAPNLGSRIVQMGESTIGALYDVRESLESMCARLAAERMTDAERTALIDMLDEHREAMRKMDSDTYPAGGEDWDFHLAILSGSRNEVAWRICGTDLRDLISLLRGRHAQRSGRGDRALLEHRWIADAIVAGNGDLASLLMAQHIRAARDNLQKMMKASAAQRKD